MKLFEAEQREAEGRLLCKVLNFVRGYDVIDYVNYGSRLSHSCASNAASVSMGVRGKYNIAVYASRDIGYGEELCFHYNSITEDEQEWRDAVCLCGTAESTASSSHTRAPSSTPR